jgi:hypothetical protein
MFQSKKTLRLSAPTPGSMRWGQGWKRASIHILFGSGIHTKGGTCPYQHSQLWLVPATYTPFAPPTSHIIALSAVDIPQPHEALL